MQTREPAAARARSRKGSSCSAAGSHSSPGTVRRLRSRKRVRQAQPALVVLAVDVGTAQMTVAGVRGAAVQYTPVVEQHGFARRVDAAPLQTMVVGELLERPQ